MATDRPSHQMVLEATAATEATMQAQRVPVNVYETPGALVVVAPMPAVTADDVRVELRPGSLRFWAHVRSAGPRAFILHEWDYGGYEREIPLPDGYGSALVASVASGQLTIRVLAGGPVSHVVTPHAH